MKTKLLCTILFTSLLGCDEDQPKISEPAEALLNDVIRVMEAKSINRSTIDWDDFRTKVFEKAGAAQTVTETQPALAEAMKLLGDNHSVLITPDGGAIGYHTIECTIQAVVKPQMPYDVGYVRVTHFGGSADGNDAIIFSNEILDQIKSQDNESIVGWIVDLRGNNGGNIWPMLAGIGPILGEGIAGYFMDADNTAISWGFENGASTNEGEEITTTDSYELINPNPKVAVLLDDGVASAGEAIAISFIGREKTRSFGAPTCGLSTANASYDLIYHYRLALTIAYLADRNKNKYGIPVPPDQVATNETIIQDAIDWIKE